MNITFVTCIYDDLFNTELGGRPHPRNRYFYGMESSLKMNAPFVIFVWPQKVKEVETYFLDFLGEEDFNKRIKVLGFDLYNTEYRDLIKKAKENTQSGKNISGDRCPDLTISKFAMLKKVSENNYFNTDIIFWIDAGLSSSALFPDKYLDLEARDRRWSKCSLFTPKVPEHLISIVKDKIVLFKNNSAGYYFNPDYIASKNEIYYIIGGIFGGKKENVIRYCNEIMDSFYYYIKEKETLYMEEELMTIVYSHNKENFQIIEFDTWHHENSGDWAQPYIIDKKNFYKIFEEFNT